MACRTNGEDKCILAEDIKGEGRRKGPIGWPRRRRIYNIKMDIRMGLHGMD
jgi:hypothetical protein